MLIYLLNFISIPFYGLCVKDRKKLVILIAFQMFLILALRADNLGVDLENYKLHFNYYKDLSFLEIMGAFSIIGRARLSIHRLEWGYVFLNWIVGKLGLDFHMFLVVCAGICMQSMGLFIYRYSKKPTISFLLFISLGGFVYFFGILRQSLGLAVFLFAIPALKERKLWKYLLIVGIATLFHGTFLITFILYFLTNINIKKIYYVGVILASISIAIITPILYRYIFSKAFGILNMSEYSLEFQWNNMFLMMMLFLIFIFLFEKPKKQEDKILNWGCILALPTQAISFYISIMSRFSIGVFLVFSYVVLANVTEEMAMTDYSKKIFKITMFVLLLLFMIYQMSGDILTVPYRSVFSERF